MASKPNLDALILDIGCGNRKQPGAYGVDVVGEQKDRDFDLEKFPWPFKESQFVLFYATQVLEHLEDSVRTMREIYRICRHGALVFVQVPNGTCRGYAQDPTHKRPWNLGTFMYFCPSQWPEDWDQSPHDYGCNFRILHYHTTGPKPGATPWGDTLFADNLTVVLQAIKEEPAQDGTAG